MDNKNYNQEVYNETSLLGLDEDLDNETTLLSQQEDDYYETTLLSQDNEEEYNETTLLSNEADDDYYYETTLLGREKKEGERENPLLTSHAMIPPWAAQAILSNIISQEKIRITKTPFTIGSLQSGVDFYVSNPAVSRKHSRIIFSKNEYYLVDNHSTNHTVLDGAVIEPEKPVKLYNGALIEMADELFQFNILKN